MWFSKLNLSNPEEKEYIVQHRNNVTMSDLAAFQDYLVHEFLIVSLLWINYLKSNVLYTR